MAKSLLIKFLNCLQQLTQECINSGVIKKTTKARDQLYFRNFLLYSDIWLVPIYSISNEKNGDNYKITTMFDFIESTVSEAYLSQKKYIWSHISIEEKEDFETWNSLLTFDDFVDDNENNLRQDSIINGFKPEISENELLMIGSTMGEANYHFDIFSAVNCNVYLTNLLLFANQMNLIFQNDVKSTFDQITHSTARFQAAPVKLRERCVTKAQTGMFEIFLFFFFLFVICK